MQTITTIGLDIAKSVFQVHGEGAITMGAIVRRSMTARFRRHAAHGGMSSVANLLTRAQKLEAVR